ncbi:hypothetical protein FHS96_002426 [Sphingomonas zeicaulis]
MVIADPAVNCSGKRRLIDKYLIIPSTTIDQIRTCGKNCVVAVAAVQDVRASATLKPIRSRATLEQIVAIFSDKHGASIAGIKRIITLTASNQAGRGATPDRIIASPCKYFHLSGCNSC